ERNCKPPLFWKGWPLKKQFALILTHDVETAWGLKKVGDLIQLEKQLGFRSAFYFVPERYNIIKRELFKLKRDGFEVGVHGLKHDGKLFRDPKTFKERAKKINIYLNEWKAKGFRAPCMHHNLDWIHALNIQYDASTFDTDPFEPQPDGVGTIFPFIVKENSTQHHYVELPYTLPQDFTLFVILKEKNIDVWKNKLNWIVENGGMALVCVHPDYMNFSRARLKAEEYPADYYLNFLQYIINNFKDQYWHVLPKDLSSFCLNRYFKERAKEFHVEVQKSMSTISFEQTFL
ncbi:MAG: hypothetical protein ACFFDN_11810, partial [Candidatus Hodarchaeota archaeon]